MIEKEEPIMITVRMTAEVKDDRQVILTLPAEVLTGTAGNWGKTEVLP